MRSLVFLPAVFLCGCATWSKHAALPRPPAKIRVAVLPVEVAVKVKRLKEIETPKAGTAEAGPDAIAEKMRRAAEEIRSDLQERLAASYFFEVAADSTTAQVLLATRLVGYGKVKKRWLVYLIGSGFLEGIAQGVALAVAAGNPWAGVGIGLEEVAQESFEWGGGAFLFNKVYSPVILEGELLSAKDGAVLWSGTSLESANRKEVKELPKEDQAKKEVRLRLTARKAAAKLVKKLDKKAWRNLR